MAKWPFCKMGKTLKEQLHFTAFSVHVINLAHTEMNLDF